MNIFAKYIYFFATMLLLETTLLFSCTEKDQDNTDNPPDDGADVPANIAGSWLTCGPVEETEQNEGYNLYGCAYLNEDGTKSEESLDQWKITIIGPDGQEFIVTEIKDADPSSKWNIVFTLPDEFVGKMFEIRGSVSLHGSPQSTLSSSCPLGYILVPGDDFYGTPDFCVMKYEAKRDLVEGKKVPVSKVDGDFFSGSDVTWEVAKSACESLGEKYSLITNEEWMTIAVNIAQNKANWSGSEVGNGFINQGHSDKLPLGMLNATADIDPCFGTWNDNCNDPTHSDWSQKRTHLLSNHEIIWDFSGNVSEWVDKVQINTKSKKWGTIFELDKLTPDNVSFDIGDIVPREKTHPWWNDTWNSAQGLGYYVSSDSKNGGAFRRGNSYLLENDSKPGIFYLDNYKAIDEPGANKNGFRCTVTK